jgi:hypothetical protein
VSTSSIQRHLDDRSTSSRQRPTSLNFASLQFASNRPSRYSRDRRRHLHNSQRAGTDKIRSNARATVPELFRTLLRGKNAGTRTARKRPVRVGRGISESRLGIGHPLHSRPARLPVDRTAGYGRCGDALPESRCFIPRTMLRGRLAISRFMRPFPSLTSSGIEIAHQPWGTSVPDQCLRRVWKYPLTRQYTLIVARES